MKALGITSTAVLSLLLAVAAPGWAHEQHEQEQKDRPAPQEEKNARPGKSAGHSERPATQDRKFKPQERNARQHEYNARPQEQNAQQHTMQAQHERRQHAGGGRIPDERFRANFGEQHRFHVHQRDYDRDRRFQYGGYWFVFGQEWPAGWLYTDDVYVNYVDDAYYLYSPVHPGIRIAINIL